MFIKQDLYKEILKSIPILCIDLIIEYKNEFLLLKRNENPLIGEWWVPGGRVRVGEKLEEAARRKLFEETSISNFKNMRKYSLYEDFFNNSSNGVHLYHTLSVVFKLEINDISEIKIDKTSKEWKFSPKLPQRFVNKMEVINE